MTRTIKRFPLVADGVPIVEEGRQMNLYEDEDLINNIHGDYVDKIYDDYDEQPSDDRQLDYENVGHHHDLVHNPLGTVHRSQEEISYAEKAREEAKRDVKQKRQSYFSNNYSGTGKTSQSTTGKSHPKISAATVRPETNQVDQIIDWEKPTIPTLLRSPEKKETPSPSLRRFSEKLRQETYILAEETPGMNQKNKKATKSKKNNYDFLKTSQIYGKHDEKEKEHHQLAQELNLTRMEEE